MSCINGKQMFEFLSKMTDEQRERCIFPGFFDDEEYGVLVSAAASNADLDDKEYNKAFAIDKGMMAKWTQDAMDKFYGTWGEYVQEVTDEVAWQIVNEAKRKRRE